MDRERDLINNVVIPEVNARLRERGEWQTSIYAVDLRWGIQTDEHDLAEVRDREILETCIAEVRRCRPLFLGLVGEKYGWIVPGAVERDYDIFRPPGLDQPLSVTAIELLTAAQEALNDGVSPTILRRVPVTAIPKEHAPRQHDGVLLDHLLGHLEGMNCRVTTYEARWDSTHECLTSDQFVALATRAILSQVDAELESSRDRHWFDIELDAQRLTSESSRNEVVGREQELSSLVAECGDLPLSLSFGDDLSNPIGQLRGFHGAHTVVVQGEEGAGVSTLLSEFSHSWMDSQSQRSTWAGFRPAALVHVGLTELSKRPEIVVLLLMAQLNPDQARSLVGGRTPDEVTMDHVLPTWLDLLAAPGSGPTTPVVVDGIEQVQSPLGLPDMRWLPLLPGGEVKFVLGVEQHSPVSKLLRMRPGTLWMSLEPIPTDAAKALVLNRVTASHKMLPHDLLTTLTARNQQPGWLTLATDMMLTIMADSYRTLGSGTGQQDPQSQLLELLRAKARELPLTIEELRLEQMYRILTVLPVERVGVVLLLLGVCSSPLRDVDLLALCGPIGLTTMELSMVRSALGSALHPGIDWHVSGQNARGALQQVIDNATEQVGNDVSLAVRTSLIGYLASLPVGDPVRESELLPQLIATGRYGDFVKAIADPAIVTEASMGRAAEALVTAPDYAALVDGLCEAVRTSDERLTLAGLLIVSLARLVMPEAHERLLLGLRAILADCPPGASRNGATAQSLLASVTATEIRNGQRSIDGAPALAWIQDIAAVPPRATLADAPAPAIEWSGPVRSLARLETIAFFAMIKAAVRAGGDDPDISPSDLESAWNSLTEAQGAPLPAPADQLRDVLVDLTRQTLAYAADGDANHESLRALVDRARSLHHELQDSESLRLWSQAVRLRATVYIPHLSETANTKRDVDLFRQLSPDFEEVIWYLDMERWLFDNDLIISWERSQARFVYASLLELFEQHTTSASYGVPAFAAPMAVNTLGAEAVVWLGGGFVAAWALYSGRNLGIDEASATDPSGWIKHVLPLLEDDPLAMFTDPEGLGSVAGLAAFAAQNIAQRHGNFDLLMEVVRLIDRKRDDPTWSEALPDLLVVLREAALELESGVMPAEDEPLAEWVADLDDSAGESEEQIAEWTDMLDSMAAFRRKLDPTMSQDITRASIGLIGAIKTRLRGGHTAHPQDFTALSALRASTDENVLARLNTIDLLLAPRLSNPDVSGHRRGIAV